MNGKIFCYIKENYSFIVLLFIILIGLLLRSYNFIEWLHFETDQSRDAIVIEEAIKSGPDQLPLLGPRASGSHLRLGPIYYYLGYGASLIVRNAPLGMALLSLLFGVLTIPLLYLFLREYFQKENSLFLTAIFSFSLYFVVYSRFAWNCNLLPFFVILNLYALIKTSKDSPRKIYWFFAFVISFLIASQLHFIAMIALALNGSFCFLFAKININFKNFLSALLIIILFSIPILINEIKTGGGNIREFTKTINLKSDNEKFLPEKIIRNYFEHSFAYSLILSGHTEDAPSKLVFKKNNVFKPKIVCKKECLNTFYSQLIKILFLGIGVFLLFYTYKNEREKNKKKFLFFIISYFVICFLILVPLSSSINSRFFLVSAPVPFVILGLFFERFKNSSTIKYLVPFIITIFLIILNFYSIKNYFSYLNDSSTKTIYKGNPVLNETSNVTFSQQLKIVEYLENSQKDNKWPIFIYTPIPYRSPFLFHLKQRKIQAFEFFISDNDQKIYRNANYFIIDLSKTKTEKTIKYFKEKFEIKEKKSFGSLTVYLLVPKENFIQQEAADEVLIPEKPESLKRFKWKEIF